MPAFSAGIAEHGLQENRQQQQAAVKHEAEHRHEKDAGRVGAVLEDAQVHHRVARMSSWTTNSTSAQTARSPRHDDPVGGEPVFLLSFIEHHLQRADTQGEHPDAPVIDPALLRAAM